MRVGEIEIPNTDAISGRRKLITISVPVLDEAENIPRLLQCLSKVAADLPAYDFEFLFTDNCSKDDTFSLLANAAKSDARIRVLRFARNFGFQKSILTNYLEARGDAAIQLDADLQDPPELIGTFLEHWEKGYKVVYGIRRRRREAFLITFAREMFYRVIAKLSEVPLPLDAGDFRLVDRCIIEHLRSSRDQSPYLRGMIPMLGYAQVGIPYDRSARTAGHTKFSIGALMRLAVDGITSQSTKPLHVITLFGFGLSFVAALSLLGYLSLWLTGIASAPPGFMTLVLLLIASIGLNALFLGVLGEYLGRVFQNVRNLPLTVIEQRVESHGEPQPAREDGPLLRRENEEHP